MDVFLNQPESLWISVKIEVEPVTESKVLKGWGTPSKSKERTPFSVPFNDVKTREVCRLTAEGRVSPPNGLGSFDSFRDSCFPPLLDCSLPFLTQIRKERVVEIGEGTEGSSSSRPSQRSVPHYLRRVRTCPKVLDDTVVSVERYPLGRDPRRCRPLR